MSAERTRTVSLVRDWLNYLTVSKVLAPKTVALYRKLRSSFVDEPCERAHHDAAYEGWRRRTPRMAHGYDFTRGTTPSRDCVLSQSSGLSWLTGIGRETGRF